MSACLAAGSIGLLVLGVQPVLLGPLVFEQRIGDSGVGTLVTVEILALAVGSIAGLKLLRQLSPVVVAAAAAVLMALANAMIISRSGLAWLLPLRGVAGLAGGLLVSLATVAIAHSAQPERMSGMFLALQTMLQLVVAACIPNLIWHGSRADAGFLALAVVGVLGLFVAPALPAQLRPAAATAGGGPIPIPNLVVLVTAGTFLGAIVTVWGYFGLWLGHHGHPPAMEAKAVSLALGFQVLGALAAAKWSEQLGNRIVIVAATIIEATIVAGLLLIEADPAFIYAASAVFGFVWLFALPSFTGLLIEIDPARRTVLYVVASQLAGAAALPSIAAMLVTEGSVDAAFVLGIITFGVTGLLLWLGMIQRRELASADAPRG